MGLELLVQHPLYTHLVRFGNSAESREKILRLLQYLTRFLRSAKLYSVISPEIAGLLKSLQAAFTLCRKPLRALKPLSHLKAFSLCISDELSDPLMRYAEALKQFGLFFFFSFDVIQWMKMLGLVGTKGVNVRFSKLKWVQKAGEYGAFMWCLALVGGLIKNARQFQFICLKNARNMENEQDEKRAPRLPLLSTSKVKRDFIKNILDLVIATNLYNNYQTDDAVIGGCGVVTSILAIQDLWKSTQ